MQILVVDDDRLVAEAIASLIETGRPAWRTSVCCSAQHALGLLDAGERFELALVDLYMPGIDGMGLLEALGTRDATLRTVLISASDDERLARAAADLGAKGFLPKTLPSATFLDGVERALDGHRVFPTAAGLGAVVPFAGTGARPKALAAESRALRLGPRQHQILQLVARGHSNKRIGLLLDIAEATVKYHVHRLFCRLDVRNRTSCVREARRLGLIDDETRAQEPGLAAVPRTGSLLGVGPRAVRPVPSPAERRASPSWPSPEDGDEWRGRLEAVGLLDGPPEAAYDNLLHLVAETLSAPIALFSVIDRSRDRQFHKSQLGVPAAWVTRRQLSLSHSFCLHAVDAGATFAVEDARAHPVLRHGPMVEELGIVAYLGVPVRAPGGSALGALCAMDVRARRWGAPDVSVLERLARCVSDAIALRCALLAA